MNNVPPCELSLLIDGLSYVQQPVPSPLMNRLMIPSNIYSNFELLQPHIGLSVPLSPSFPLQVHHCPPFSLFARL